MMFCSPVVCVPLLLAVAAASDVANGNSEMANLTSEVLTETSEVKDDSDAGKRTYEGYKLFRVTPVNKEHLDVLRFIEKSVDSIWTPIPDELEAERQSHIDMMVNPMQSENLRAFLECSSIPFEVKDYFRYVDLLSYITLEQAQALVKQSRHKSIFQCPFQRHPLLQGCHHRHPEEH